MTGDRYRLVYTGKGETHVSSVVLGEEEVREHLELEREIHARAGWTVTLVEKLCICRRGDSLRTIEAKKFSPFDDLRA